MRYEETSHDPTPDPRLEAALGSLADEPPLESVDWERLRGSIRARAELPLARRRGRAPRSTGRARSRVWRPLLPLAAAASIALAVWAGGDRGGSQDIATVGTLSVEDVFRSDLSDQEFSHLVSGGADPEGLLLIVLDER